MHTEAFWMNEFKCVIQIRSPITDRKSQNRYRDYKTKNENQISRYSTINFNDVMLWSNIFIVPIVDFRITVIIASKYICFIPAQMFCVQDRNMRGIKQRENKAPLRPHPLTKHVFLKPSCFPHSHMMSIPHISQLFLNTTQMTLYKLLHKQ